MEGIDCRPIPGKNRDVHGIAGVALPPIPKSGFPAVPKPAAG
jgi:hypothetical protein